MIPTLVLKSGITRNINVYQKINPENVKLSFFLYYRIYIILHVLKTLFCVSLLLLSWQIMTRSALTGASGGITFVIMYAVYGIGFW